MAPSKQRKLHWFSSDLILPLFIIIPALSLLWGCAEKNAASEQDTVYLTESSYDFGIVPDSVHKVNHIFTLVNNTKDTCHILHINKSCGCTDIKANSTTIPPHSSTEISVSLSLTNEYHFVERDASIHTDLTDTPLTLYVNAVRAVPPFLIQKEFPVKLGQHLRFSSDIALLGYAQHGEEKSFSINILNTSDSPRSLKMTSELPKGFEVIYPEELEPQEISRIVFTCTPSDKQWGQINFFCTFADENGEELKVNGYAIITEKFQRGAYTSPRICVPFNAYSAKKLRDDNKIVYDIVNIGQDSLMIRHIGIPDNRFRAYVNHRSTPPGDTCHLTVRQVNLSPIDNDISIGVVTNDRLEPYKELRIIADSQ